MLLPVEVESHSGQTAQSLDVLPLGAPPVGVVLGSGEKNLSPLIVIPLGVPISGPEGKIRNGRVNAGPVRGPAVLPPKGDFSLVVDLLLGLGESPVAAVHDDAAYVGEGHLTIN